ncbi:hypothetical protein L596_002159 [Steinernema carpocapsae]|uniref:Uncharacterized protein n=1 Tax=Steinernema carpocapsae TaxID=34508 RepID=A0A4U8UND9_STECR|nr:hypothetical protein L596_002159 [Steinernema carpocapsae]
MTNHDGREMSLIFAFHGAHGDADKLIMVMLVERSEMSAPGRACRLALRRFRASLLALPPHLYCCIFAIFAALFLLRAAVASSPTAPVWRRIGGALCMQTKPPPLPPVSTRSAGCILCLTADVFCRLKVQFKDAHCCATDCANTSAPLLTMRAMLLVDSV